MNSRRLPSGARNINFGTLIKTKDGVVTGMHHAHDHHILLKSKSEFKKIFDKSGQNIKFVPINRMLLPDDIGHSIFPTNRSLHSGMHDQTSYGHTLKAVEITLIKGADNSWSAARYAEKIAELTNKERNMLMNGERKLNNALNLWEKIRNGKFDK